MTIMVSAHVDWASAPVEAVEHLMEQLTVLGNDPASQAAQYHLRSGGSRVRCRLGLHAGQMLGLEPSAQTAIATTCELLHNASLIHDRFARSRPAAVDAAQNASGSGLVRTQRCVQVICLFRPPMPRLHLWPGTLIWPR